MTDRKRTLYICAALLAAVVALYSHLFQCDFILFDDDTHVLENPCVLAGLTPASIQWAFTHFIAVQWIPGSWLSHMLDVSLFGLDPGWHHLGNLVLHALNACLVFLVLRSFTGRFWPSVAVAALFAVHPINVESVAWIAERKNVLSTTFWLLALAAYRCYIRHPGGRWMWLVAAGMAAGLLAKPMLVTLPFALLLLDVWPLRRSETSSWFSLVREKSFLWLLSATSSGITLLAAAHHNSLVDTADLTTGDRLANATVGYAASFQHLFWPSGLSVLYPIRAHIAPCSLIVAGIVLLGVTLGCWLRRKKEPFLLVGWLWFIGILFPVSGVMQVGTQAYADRFTYVPQLGIFCAVVWWLDSWKMDFRRWGPAGGAIVLALLGFCTWRQVHYWTDTVTLFEHALQVGPRNGIAHAVAGEGWVRREDYPKAVAHLWEARRFLPRNAAICALLGDALIRVGDPAGAVQQFGLAVELEPRDSVSRYKLISLLSQQGKLEEAAKYLPKNDAAPARP